jgi:hypothetical protein
MDRVERVERVERELRIALRFRLRLQRPVLKSWLQSQAQATPLHVLRLPRHHLHHPHHSRRTRLLRQPPTQSSAPGHATTFSTTPMTTTTSVVIFATTPSLEQIQAARDLILKERRLFLAYSPQRLLNLVSSDLPVPGGKSESLFKDGDVCRLWEAGFQNVAHVARIELVAQVQERLMCPSRVPLARMLGRLGR